MKLFRRLLLSLFPRDMVNQHMNPANMFVSFISPKQFFSVINRKIVENYKLNLFDICLDPFEVKIGFGDQPTLNVRDIDFYYAYGSTAHMNGRNFYTPSNVGTAITLVMATSTKQIFKGYHHHFFVSFLVSVYLLTYVFSARLKVFPYDDKEENYRWFIDVFFAFFQTALDQAKASVDTKAFEAIKAKLLQEIHLFFMLFYFYQKMNKLFASPSISDKEFYQRLFHDDFKKGQSKKVAQDFMTGAEVYTRRATFSNLDMEVMKTIFPADVLIRYIVQGEDSYIVVDKLIGSLYDQEKLNTYLHSFLKGEDQFEVFLHYIMDWRLFRARYFKGIKKLTTHKFRLKHDYEMSQEIDSFISSLEDTTSLDGVKVPDVLKQESMMMDKLVNFYVTYLGGLRVARGDNFYLRLFRKPMVDALILPQDMDALKQDSLFYYGGLLYNYSKNVFYYKYAYENVKAGRDSFHLPFKSSFKEVYSNMFILKLFDENFVHTILQDVNKKSIKIYVKNKKILDTFKYYFGTKISRMMKADRGELLRNVYDDVVGNLQSPYHMISILSEYLLDEDVSTIKENLYSFDMHLWLEALEALVHDEISLHESYSDMTILGIIASLRETLFGFLLRYSYVYQEEQASDIDLHRRAIKKIYIVDVLNIAEKYIPLFDDLLETLLHRYYDLFQDRVSLDENKRYFSLGVGNWLGFTENREGDAIINEVMGEDVIRFRGYLKTISYYNKRYLIPK